MFTEQLLVLGTGLFNEVKHTTRRLCLYLKEDKFFKRMKHLKRYFINGSLEL